MIDFKSISEECVKCGKCIPTCTIHTANPDEVTSPRGFLELLGAYDRGDLDLDKNAKNIFESCFLCTNCVDVCPNTLPIDAMIENVRADIAKKYGIAFYKRAFFWFLRHRFFMDLASKLGYIFQTCGFKIKDELNSMQPRFSLPMIKKDRLLPSLGSKSFLNSHPPIIENGGEGKVGIFIGCLANYNYTDIGEGLLEIFKALKIDVYLLKKQACCGAPAYFTGDFDTVDILARKNIAYFKEVLKDLDAIVIPEATCSAMIKEDYPHFFDLRDESLSKDMKELNKKIFMATEYLEKHTDLKNLLAKKQKQTDLITYHDPCHARKMQGIYKEPRSLLSQNYKLKEMSDPNACCGFGGVTIQAEKHHLAKTIGDKKAQMIDQTKAKYVSAECSACKMQITNSLFQNKSEVLFKNPIELIAEALRD
ncbi:MAG: glycerol-3-phosphate dehydrogenase [Proteobacteria bacterium]|nr:MAG: glycerol-3-phosphate dehydrogenase [Pseudomonadota bacterium]